MLLKVSNMIYMLNDLLMFSRIWFDETMFRNDMIKIIFKKLLSTH